MKKILILAIPLFFLYQSVVSGSTDVSNGLLDDTDNIKSIDFLTEWYDNDLDTSARMADTTSYHVEFEKPVDINKVFLKGSDARTSSSLNIYFLDDDDVNVDTLNFSGVTNIHELNVNYQNVIRITLSKTRTFIYYIFEVEFFGFLSDERPEVPPEVENVKIESKHDRVDLSWRLPNTNNFDHVNIYRRELEGETTSFFNWIKPMTLHASEYKAIFQTNGTVFRDLTVEPEVSYEYRLTTEYRGMESQGVNVQTSTAPAPPPPMVDIGSVNTPFTVVDMVKVGMQIFAIIGGFVLLGLAFRFVPKMIKMIFSVNKKEKENGKRYVPREMRR